MRHRTRRATIAAAVATVLVAGLGVPSAQAIAPEWTLTKKANSRNGSDPSVEYCHINNRPFMCMYTSSDLDKGDLNVYPMDTTYLYTLDMGVDGDGNQLNLDPGDPDNWFDHGAVLNESEDYGDWVGAGAEHLWAPSMAYGPDAKTVYLYVPDTNTQRYTTLTVAGVEYELNYSNIGVSVASSPAGPFTYLQRISYRGSEIKDIYMSDPRVVTFGFSHPGDITPEFSDDNEVLNSRQGGTATWLLWANGVWHNTERCGGISIGLLDETSMTRLYTNPARSASEIQINGLEQFGKCNDASTGPYIEGPELYDLASVGVPLPGGNGRFMLVFSLKPADANRNQVIAYATAPTPLGPYTYRGILMDGSDDSWTNQGSVWADSRAAVTKDNPLGLRFILFYHDDNPGNRHNRKVYATCLTYDLSERRFLTAQRPTSQPNLNDCVGTRP